MTQYRAQQDISITCFESGTEIELKMVVTFKVHPGSPGTHVDPPEYPAVEVDQVQFFRINNEKALPIAISLPVWMIDELTEGEGFENWLMSEASEQAEQARDEAAGVIRRKELREDRG